MKKKGPILVFEDDPDDLEFLREAVISAGVSNELIAFDDAEKFIAYLHATTEQPFIILSDINVSKVTGVELKERIDANPFLKAKAIPFVFLSTSKYPKTVTETYDRNAQGYFVKKESMTEIRKQIEIIFNYWQEALHPRDEY